MFLVQQNFFSFTWILFLSSKDEPFNEFKDPVFVADALHISA